MCTMRDQTYENVAKIILHLENCRDYLLNKNLKTNDINSLCL